jgi:predicted nuclease of predicted toxin-antitoxin system
VKFVVDAQLPPRLATRLALLGHDVVHATSLAGGDRMPDREIAACADEEDRVVVTKDSDFRCSHTVSGTPAWLLLIATGNIRNDELLALV